MAQPSTDLMRELHRFLLAEPGRTARLLAAHADDGHGRCTGCRLPGYGTPDGQWPCIGATAATTLDR